MDRIKSTLSSDLDHLFATTLNALVGREGGKAGKGSEMEKSKLYADVTECLRTYDALGLWRDAEDVVRREVVSEFVKKVSHRLRCFFARHQRCFDRADDIPRGSFGTPLPRSSAHTISPSD